MKYMAYVMLFVSIISLSDCAVRAESQECKRDQESIKQIKHRIDDIDTSDKNLKKVVDHTLYTHIHKEHNKKQEEHKRQLKKKCEDAKEHCAHLPAECLSHEAPRHKN